MPDPKETAAARFVELQTNVKSKILERIAEQLKAGASVAAKTMYTKSDGTNYGKYEKADDLTAIVNIWERVFPVNPGVITPVVGGGRIGGEQP